MCLRHGLYFTKWGCEKSPLHQEHSNINTVEADALGGLAEKSQKYEFALGEYVGSYVFARGCAIFESIPRGLPKASAPTLSIDFFTVPFYPQKRRQIQAEARKHTRSAQRAAGRARPSSFTPAAAK